MCMTRKCHKVTQCRSTHGIVRKGHRILTATWHHKNNQSKTTGPLLPIEMISKLENAPNTAQQNKDQIQINHNGRNDKHLINNIRISALEWKAAEATWVLN